MSYIDNPIVNNAKIILNQVKTVIVGKNKTLLWVLAAILAKGHILMEDIPGVGKTTMALAFARTLGLETNRVQFTPDVLPSDVTGYSILSRDGSMIYKPGAVLCNLFLADELNRATSRTQSALLEAMEEGQVTVDGQTHKIPQPFFVIATQNPTGAAGTQPLPDSQADRFMVQLSLGYPSPEDEIAMVDSRQGKNPLTDLCPILSAEALIAMQELVEKTYISKDVTAYIVTLIHETRKHPKIALGASPRATLAVVSMSKAIAQLHGRDYVVPKDVQEVFIQTLSHRISMKPHAQDMQRSELLQQILQSVKAPTVN